LIYSSFSISLVVLEILVYLQHSSLLFTYVGIPAEFPEDLVEELELGDMPQGWNAHPASVRTQRIGDEWDQSGSTLVLAVPSVVVLLERNYLINPDPPEVVRVEAGESRCCPLTRA
jgi:RES domain-containing protein